MEVSARYCAKHVQEGGETERVKRTEKRCLETALPPLRIAKIRGFGVDPGKSVRASRNSSYRFSPEGPPRKLAFVINTSAEDVGQTEDEGQ